MDYIIKNKMAWTLINAGINIKKLAEYAYDVGLADEYEGKGFPLSFILIGEK